MPRTVLWMLAIVGGLALGGGVLWWMFGEDEPARAPGGRTATEAESPEPPIAPPTKPAPPPNDFVGSEACRECHPGYWEKYQTNPMSHTLFHAAATSPSEDFEQQTTFSAGRHEYRVEKRDGQVWHHELARDAAGEVIYDQAVEVQFAVGSGKRGRSYFVDRGGLLFMSPVSWYSDREPGRWDLSPSFQPDGHLRFERRVLDACVSCHSGQANPRPGAPDRFYTPAFHELSIGCERCHGPGGGHIEFRRSSAPPGDRTDPIVNPSLLDAPRRDAVCYQCHLLGQERVLQYGRSEYDFRPGMYMSDVWAVLVEGTGVTAGGATEAVSQTEQMLASRCYQASEGQLGCTSCHDPHSAPTRAERREYYRERCLTCHTEDRCRETLEVRRQSDNDSCFVCHLPRLNATDVPHTSQTDHRVLRRPATHKNPPAVAVNPEELRIFEMGTPALPAPAERRARSLLLAEYAQARQDTRLAARIEKRLEPLAEAAPDDVAVLVALAQVADVQQATSRSFERWNAVLTVVPTHEVALRTLALQSIAARRPQDASMYLERYLLVNRWDAGLRMQRSRLLLQLGRDQEALAEARQAVEMDPSRPEYYDWLVTLCTRQNLTEDAQRYEELRQRLAPR